MSLADELLADFEELGGEEEEENEDGLGGGGEFGMDLEDLNDNEFGLGDGSQGSATSIAKLLQSDSLKYVMDNIALQRAAGTRDRIEGVIEEDPEYKLIVKASTITVEIANEVNILHKYIRDIYTNRFSELEQIVVEPMAYIRCVHAIGNDIDITKVDLSEIIPPHIVMIVSVSGSTSQGQPLSDEDIGHVKEACEMAFKLEEAVKDITDYVESRMVFISPNLSAICGPSTAAKLMGLAGGITALAKMPSCNLQLLGAQKKAMAGFTNLHSLPHCGFIYFCELVDPLAAEFKRKAVRMISGKCTLAARMDACHEYRDGSKGKAFREELEKKIETLTEPAPARLEKPLPVPEEGPRKRRGGRRVRKMKNRTIANDVDKAMNRLKFGEIQDDLIQTKMGYDVGMLGKGGTGSIRTAQVDNKVRTTITKRMQREMARQKAMGGFQTAHTTSKSSVSTTSGTSSSVVYSADVGLEIVNPDAAEKVAEIEGKYFSTTSNFRKTKK